VSGCVCEVHYRCYLCRGYQYNYVVKSTITIHIVSIHNFSPLYHSHPHTLYPHHSHPPHSHPSHSYPHTLHPTLPLSHSYTTPTPNLTPGPLTHSRPPTHTPTHILNDGSITPPHFTRTVQLHLSTHVLKHTARVA